MNKNILKYISTEKEISRYNIGKLESKKLLSPSNKRILDIEREFVNLPLENIKFEDVADVASAIAIYRGSRSLFHKTYNIVKMVDDSIGFNFNTIEKKISFLSCLSNELLNIRVKEINVVQDNDLYQEMMGRFPNIDIENESLENLLKIEPIKISKKRARLQAALYSLGLYIDECVRACVFNKNMTNSELIIAGKSLDFILTDAMHNVFKHYNTSLKILSEDLLGTMGENKYLNKVHELINILDFNALIKDAVSLPRPIEYNHIFESDRPTIANLFVNQKDINKSKVFGILLPILRTGNERMTLLYKEIYFEDVLISNLFSNNISNVKAINSDNCIEYYKSILMPNISSLVEIAGGNNDILEIINKLLILGNNSVAINDKESIILAPKTRSEEDGILEVIPIIENKILSVTDNYFRATGTTNDMI